VDNNAHPEPAMNYPDLETARRHHAALKALFGDSRIERRGAVRKVEALCRAASCAIDDADCRETLGIVGDYASRMLSGRKQRGAQFLRLQIDRALDFFDSRLSSMEVIRRAGAQVANQGER
jgi:hypothetical protein